MSEDIVAVPEAAAARFWDFSVAVYGAPEVATACLALQDAFGVDVNLLLFCCWTAAEGAPPLSGAEIARAAAAIRPWRERAVAPLRGIRRDLKASVTGLDEASRDNFRKRVAALELEAERIAQRLLVAAVPFVADIGRTPAERLAAGAANIVDDGLSAGNVLAAAQISGLAVVLGAALGVPADRAGLAIAAAIRSRAEGSAVL